jgi:hypothetical protein
VFSLAFFFYKAFLGRFSVRGVQKHNTQYANIFTKSQCRKLFLKTSTKFSMSVFPRLCFIAFQGVSQRWEFKTIQKTFCKKSRVERVLQKKPDFFYIVVNHVFGRFSVRGVQKHGKKK